MKLIEAEITAAVAEPSDERLSAAIGAVELLGMREGDTLRIALAETMLENGAAALAPLVIDDQVAARSPTARAVRDAAAAAAALVPNAASGATGERPIELLRRKNPPPIEPDQPITSGRAVLDVVDEEIDLLKEIARDE